MRAFARAALLAGALGLSAVEVGAQALFQALGHEPGWRARISATQLDFQSDDGTRFALDQGLNLSTAARTEPLQLGLQWQGQPLLLRAEPQLCRDARSGLPYPWRVSLTLAGKVYLGCGGDPALLLQGSDWLLRSADGLVLGKTTALRLRFEAGGRFLTQLPCNTGQGRYRADEQGLALTALSSTRRACADGALMQLEQQLQALLPQVLRFEFDESKGNELQLRLLDGRKLRLAKAPASP